MHTDLKDFKLAPDCISPPAEPCPARGSTQMQLHFLFYRKKKKKKSSAENKVKPTGLADTLQIYIVFSAVLIFSRTSD